MRLPEHASLNCAALGNYGGCVTIPVFNRSYTKTAPASRIITLMHQTLIFASDGGLTNTSQNGSASHLRDLPPRTLRRIAIGLGISFCLHVLFFVFAPKRDNTQEIRVQESQGPLVVRLSPAAKPSPPAAAQVPPAQSPSQTLTPPRPRTPLPPTMMTVPSITPQATPLLPEPPVALAPPRPPETTPAAPTDFMSMVNANRERREAAQAAAGGRGREPSADDIAMANINRNAQTLRPRDGTSGVFQILSKGHRAAQFSFRGWTNDVSNSRREVIDVDAGLNGNIELAIVRRMIALIRTHYQGNFNWDSHRLGRVVALSARVEDTAGLEEFMMREFF